MARVFITGSTDGLGRAAARTLIHQGHQVVLHARSRERASALDNLASRSAGLVVGDLARALDTRRIAAEVNAIGPMDAVIHNAGISSTEGRAPTPEGHATILAVNTLAPYMLTALIDRPRRFVYLSSSMHRGGTPSLGDIDWRERRWNSSQAYSDSKLCLTDLHMRMFRFLRRSYPGVNVGLHAGELALGLVPPEKLGRHVRQAIEVGGACAAPGIRCVSTFAAEEKARLRHELEAAFERFESEVLQTSRQK